MIELLERRRLCAATLVDGVLTVDGTPGDDRIAVEPLFRLARTLGLGGRPSNPVENQVVVRVNDESDLRFDWNEVREIIVRAGDGNDTVAIRDVIGTTVEGGGGNDLIYGGGSGDTLDGGAGDDRIVGGRAIGEDVIRGGAGNDRLYGLGGNDTLAGDDGDDLLVGGRGRDTLDGGAGRDRVRGGPGRDQFLDTDDPSERLDFGSGDRILLSNPPIAQGGPMSVLGDDLLMDDTSSGVGRGRSW